MDQPHPSQEPRHLPSEEEIAAATARIRSGWSEAERLRRAPHLVSPPARQPCLPSVATWGRTAKADCYGEA